jgi:uncharacterized protein YcnI
MSITHARLRTSAAIACAAGIGCAAVLLSAGSAFAHVETEPGQAPKGDQATVNFRVPNEETNAGVVKLQVNFPADHPIAEALTMPMPGWTSQVSKAKLPQPVHQNNSDVTDAVQSVTWSAQPGTQIAPDQFSFFPVLAGPMPDNTDQLVMPTVQTYSNGDVVEWKDAPPAPGAPRPEHPAPVLKLVAADQMAGASTPSPATTATGVTQRDNTARWLGGAGLVLGALALGLAAGAILRIRHRSAP